MFTKNISKNKNQNKNKKFILINFKMVRIRCFRFQILIKMWTGLLCSGNLMNLRLVSGGLKVIVSFYQSSSIKKINFT